jgi:hypothetical protein
VTHVWISREVAAWWEEARQDRTAILDVLGKGVE